MDDVRRTGITTAALIRAIHAAKVSLLPDYNIDRDRIVKVREHYLGQLAEAEGIDRAYCLSRITECDLAMRFWEGLHSWIDTPTDEALAFVVESHRRWREESLKSEALFIDKEQIDLEMQSRQLHLLLQAPDKGIEDIERMAAEEAGA